MAATKQSATLEMHYLSMLEPHPKNVRDRAVADEEMVASVREQGIHQPLVVAPSPTLEGNFVVIMGHRRLDAAKKAGLEQVPVLVRHDLLDERDQIAAMVQENMHRKDLSVAEEATAIQAMLDFDGWDPKRVAKETGLTVRRVKDRAKLTRLADTAFVKLQCGQLTIERAEVLADFAGTPEEEALLEVADAHPTNWDWHVARARAAREWRKRRPAVLKDLAAAGVEVIDAPEQPLWRADCPWAEAVFDSAEEAAAAGARAIVPEVPAGTAGTAAGEVTYVVPRPAVDETAAAEAEARAARAALMKELDGELEGMRELEAQWLRDTVLPAADRGDERVMRVLARHYQAAVATAALRYDIHAAQAAVLGLDQSTAAAVAEAVEGKSLAWQSALWLVAVRRVELQAWCYEGDRQRALDWLRLRAELGWEFVDPEVRAVRELAGEDGPAEALARLAGLAPASAADAEGVAA